MFAVEPEIVLGPPGTGKTTALLGHVRAALEAGTPPDRVGFLTFTRRAAEEAQSRMREQFNLRAKELPYFRTIHSLCMRWVALPTGAVLERERMAEFADWIGERITGRFSLEDGTWSGYERGDRMLFMDGMARARRVPLRRVYEECQDDLEWRPLERFSAGLAQFKKDRHLYDYTDMLELFVKRATAPPLDLLLVDEAQDLSLLQWEVVRMIGDAARRVVVAGDDDQALYVWSGADVRTLIELPGRVQVLGHSFRVPRAVQALAEGIIVRVQHRRAKTWSPRDAAGLVKRVASYRMADWSGDSVMVLARNRYQLEPVERELRGAGVLFESQGRPSVPQAMMDRIVTWEHLRADRRVPVADARRVYELMSVNVGFKTGFKTLPRFPDDAEVSMMDLLESGGLLTTEIWHRALDRLPPQDRAYIVRCRKNGERLSVRPRVRLSTIHGSKGGEADRVVLMTDLAPRTWRESLAAPDDEARVWYVGATRARYELCVVEAEGAMRYEL